MFWRGQSTAKKAKAWRQAVAEEAADGERALILPRALSPLPFTSSAYLDHRLQMTAWQKERGHCVRQPGWRRAAYVKKARVCVMTVKAIGAH